MTFSYVKELYGANKYLPFFFFISNTFKEARTTNYKKKNKHELLFLIHFN